MQIKINLKIFLFLLLFFLTNQIEIYTILMAFTIIHELGHLITGIILKLKPKKLTIMPLGVNIIFEEYTTIKKLNIKKIIIACAGPLANILIIFFLLIIHKANTENIIYANVLIAVFNLLPIYPLDGGTILKCILREKLGLYASEKISYYTTNISLIILTIVGSIVTLSIKNIAFTVIIIYLWILVIKENKRYELKQHAYEVLEKNVM